MYQYLQLANRNTESERALSRVGAREEFHDFIHTTTMYNIRVIAIKQTAINNATTEMISELFINNYYLLIIINSGHLKTL